MKKLRKIPYLPCWLAAIFVGLWVFFPTYAYNRLIPLTLSAIITCFGLIALLGRRQPKAARVLGIIVTVILIVGFLMVSITGILILNTAFSEPEEHCEYIVVLGAQVKSYGPSASLQERIDRAYEYLIQHPDTVAIVTGGKGSDEPISEAQCMFDELTAMGIDESRIWMEDQATSTWENLKFSLDMIEEKTGVRPNSIGVVSSEYHLFRTAMQAADRGLEVVGIPAKTAAFDRFLHYFLREIAGVWHYIILGGLYT